MPNSSQFFTFALSLFVCGCSAEHPVLYPNEAFMSADEKAIDKEIDRCERLAKHYTGDPDARHARDTAVDSTILSAIGAATGTAIGAVTGGVGRGAAIGAIGGASGGVTHGILSRRSGYSESSVLYRNFVQRCLSERGLETIGWK